MKAQNLVLIIVIVAVFYFLMIMPQRRNQKKRQEMMRQLGIGAQVVSAGGIHGEVTEVFDDSVLLEIADGVEIKMDRRSIIRVLESADTEDEDTELLEDDSVDETEQATVEDETVEHEEEK